MLRVEAALIKDFFSHSVVFAGHNGPVLSRGDEPGQVVQGARLEPPCAFQGEFLELSLLL